MRTPAKAQALELAGDPGPVEPLADVPALIRRERAVLAELAEPADVVDAERRAAAIAELTRRARLAVPIQNEATFLRAEALERLAVVVDEAQERGELRRREDGRPEKASEPRRLSDVGVDYRRLAEGRAIARSGVLAEARERAAAEPDRPLHFAELVRQAERRQREQANAERRAQALAEARQHRRELEAAGGRTWKLELADVRAWAPGPVDAILTDPPYVTADAVELYEALGDFAARELVDGGVLAVMLPAWLLEDVVDVLRRPELAYRWAIVWRFGTHANTFDYRRRVFDLTKLVLVYHRGAMPADAPTWPDLLESPGDEKDLHTWQQSEEGFGRLVEWLTLPGELVCDPFVGAGTTGAAAIARERRFVGCDVDEAALATARSRLAA